MALEIWADVPGYTLPYQVSNLGNMRRLPYMAEGNDGLVTHRMKLIKVRFEAGWARVSIDDGTNRRKSLQLHHLVARAFLPDYPPGDTPAQIYHINGDRMDNRAENLALIRDGDGKPLRVNLTEDELEEIRYLSDGGMKGAELARRYQRTPSSISRIINGNRHRWQKRL